LKNFLGLFAVIEDHDECFDEYNAALNIFHEIKG
jgi:hypothetical protein